MPGSPPSLAEHLGHAADARRLIVNCDDLGGSASATSATPVITCPWAMDALQQALA